MAAAATAAAWRRRRRAITAAATAVAAAAAAASAKLRAAAFASSCANERRRVEGGKEGCVCVYVCVRRKKCYLDSVRLSCNRVVVVENARSDDCDGREGGGAGG